MVAFSRVASPSVIASSMIGIKCSILIDVGENVMYRTGGQITTDSAEKAAQPDINQIQNRSSHIRLQKRADFLHRYIIYDRTAMATPAATMTPPAARLSRLTAC